MNKADLIDAVHKKTGDSKTKVGETIDAIFDAITAELKKGEEVRVPNFGVFAVVDTAARMARNPQTGEPVPVAARRRARFRPGKALNDSLEVAKKPAATSKKK